MLLPLEISTLDEGEISVGANATLSGRPLQHGNNYELSEFDATRGPTYR